LQRSMVRSTRRFFAAGMGCLAVAAGLSAATSGTGTSTPQVVRPKTLAFPAVPRLTIRKFVAAQQPIREQTTKFGGQPVWLDKPQWPLSRTLGIPMQFICQIALDPSIFGELPGRMAYLFMTDDERIGAKTSEANGGENAVIIQPGGVCRVQTIERSTGPTLERTETTIIERSIQPDPGSVSCPQTPPGKEVFECAAMGPNRVLETVYRRHPCEYAVVLESGVDPQIPYRSGGDGWEVLEQYYPDPKVMEDILNALAENKIGGTPEFIQAVEYPDEERTWKLLLQFDGEIEGQTLVNFGTGTGYAFISSDGREGGLIWQTD